MSEARAELAALDRVLCDGAAASGDRLDAAWRLHALLSDLAGMPGADTGRDTSMPFAQSALAHGLALSPFDAGLCTRDPLRTAAFALGLRRAIDARRGAGPVRVLYAGTGPLAPLAALQVPHFSPDALRLTLLDLHPVSLKSARRVMGALGADGLAERYVQADATDWRPPIGTRYDVIVAEVLQRALSREPQVAATRALARFLAPGGAFVPSDIALDLVLVQPGDLVGTPPYAVPQPVAPALRLTAQTAQALVPDANGLCPLGEVSCPAPQRPGDPLVLMTRIETYGGITLDHGQSGLTMPHPLWHLEPPRGACRLTLGYRMGTDPGFEVQLRAPSGQARANPVN